MGNQIDVKNESKQRRIIDMPYNVCESCSKKTKQQKCEPKCITFWPPFDDKFCKCKYNLTCYKCLKRHGKDKLCRDHKFRDSCQIKPEDACKGDPKIIACEDTNKNDKMMIACDDQKIIAAYEDDKKMVACKNVKSMTTCKDNTRMTTCEDEKNMTRKDDIIMMKCETNQMPTACKDAKRMTFYEDDRWIKSIKNDKKKISELNYIMCSKV